MNLKLLFVSLKNVFYIAILIAIHYNFEFEKA